VTEWNWTEGGGYDMSGWDDGHGKAKVQLEIELDLVEASEWMAGLDDDLTPGERSEALKTVLGSLSKKWAPTNQKEPVALRENRTDIRPSDVRITELEPETDKVHFYSGYKVLSDKWLGSRDLADWPKIFEHMKKSMHPDFDDANAPQIKWAPKEN
jgi:hypothetical protein